MRSCRDCGLGQRLPSLAPRQGARCVRCGASLRHTWSNPLSLGLALSLASLVMFTVGATNVLSTVETVGQRRTAGLFSGPAALWQHGLWELAMLVFAISVAVPLATVGASLYVLAGVRLHRPPPGLRQVFRFRNRLRPWSMVEVFLVGYFVAYAKLGDLVHIEPGIGFYALFGFMVATIAIDALVDPQAVWEAIARHTPTSPLRAATPAMSVASGLMCCPVCELACDPAVGAVRCPRCGSAVHRRKPDSAVRTAALTASALVFYIPANIFPVLTVVQLGRGSPSTIVGGVWELLGAGQWPLAMIVFTASVAVPMLKIIGLGVMLSVALRIRTSHLWQLTVLYRVISVIGRWSMIDIFMEAILAALVQFGAVATIDPGFGAVAFAAAVVLTMFAAESFDPRLMWDAAGR